MATERIQTSLYGAVDGLCREAVRNSPYTADAADGGIRGLEEFHGARTNRYAHASDRIRSGHATQACHLYQSVKDQSGTNVPNHRLAFYRQLHVVESLEMPHALHSKEDQESIAAAKQAAIGELVQWRPDVADLYSKADADHVAIKTEKPGGRYLKHALALSVRPIIQNIVAFQLTGQESYARQSTQHLTRSCRNWQIKVGTLCMGFSLS